MHLKMSKQKGIFTFFTFDQKIVSADQILRITLILSIDIHIFPPNWWKTAAVIECQHLCSPKMFLVFFVAAAVLSTCTRIYFFFRTTFS